MDDAFHDAWFWFDWPLLGGGTPADRLIAEGPPLSAGERRFLDAARASCMRLYEVEDTRPGLSVTLREVLRRKTFWVDESLAFLLARTDLDVPGRDLRLPFASFAVVFTDRHVLSLAERLLARDPTCAIAGSFLRVATVYVTEEVVASGRVLRLVFALDALGADVPHLLEHLLAIDDDAPIELPTLGEALVVATEGESLPPPLRPLRGLVQVVLNAVLYATSAGVEPRAHPRPRALPTTASEVLSGSSDEVYHLPGTIPISRLRQMQDLERAPGGRGLLHRFLVRGHWRRPSTGWKDQRMRWIEPYWKGPDLAAIIERAYKLKP